MMFDFGPHAPFIYGSYGLALVVLGVMVGFAFWRRAVALRRLRAAEARSGGGASRA